MVGCSECQATSAASEFPLLAGQSARRSVTRYSPPRHKPPRLVGRVIQRLTHSSSEARSAESGLLSGSRR